MSLINNHNHYHNHNHNNHNDDFITVFPLKGGSSSVKFTLILKIIIVIIILIKSYSYVRKYAILRMLLTRVNVIYNIYKSRNQTYICPIY